MKKNKKHGIIVLIVILAIALIALALQIFSPTNENTKFGNTTENEMRFIKRKNKNENYIASIYISGVIQSENLEYNQAWLLDTIKSLKEDKQNAGIAIFIDSPGGTVYEADEAYLCLLDYKESGKPVYVYQGSLAASGGYYISCAADKIYANRNTLTGSIGVIMGSSYDLTGLYEKLGIKSETIHSGRNKNMFSTNEPVTDEQREIMQSVADECYDQFTGIVAMSRNIPIIEVKKLADGRIYTANQALKNGLIDSISSWDGMLKDMKENCFQGKDIPVIDFRYEREQTLKDYFFGAVLGNAEKKALSNAISKASIMYPAYLYTF